MQLNQEIVTMLALPDIRQRLASFDLEPVGSSPEQMASHLRPKSGNGAKAVRDAKLTPRTVH